MLKRLWPSREEPVELELTGLGVPVLLRRSNRARRLSLQVNEAKRGAVLTIPARASHRSAERFLFQHLDWLKQRIAKLPEPVAFAHGAVIPLRGAEHRLNFPGAVARRGVVWAEAGHPLPQLVVAGAPHHAPRRLRDWLKRQAQADLKQSVAAHAASLGLAPKRVIVRDQTTRWGSCSTGGVLSFSWRLVLAPCFVLDYLAAHEVAHLAEMNHGPRFWALVARSMPLHDEARSWLKKHGAGLHRYGA
jgi:predicted metal-dependent hydrolase